VVAITFCQAKNRIMNESETRAFAADKSRPFSYAALGRCAPSLWLALKSEALILRFAS
jgi:hypothetical protein